MEYDVTTLLNSGDADYLRDLDEALRRRVVELCRELLEGELSSRQSAGAPSTATDCRAVLVDGARHGAEQVRRRDHAAAVPGG